MDKQSFYDNQLVTNANLNTALSNAEAGDKSTAKDGIGFGVSFGMMVTSVSGHMQINVSNGAFIDKAGLVYEMAGGDPGIIAQPVVTDFYGNSITVGAGQECWVAVFAIIGRSLQGYATNSSGGVHDNTNYTQQPSIINPNGNVIAGVNQVLLVRGSPAAIGSAERVNLASTAVLLCDLYVTYGQTDFSAAGAIDYQRREMLQRVEQQYDGLIPANGNYGFYLWQTFGRGALTTRIYVSARLGGLLITTNAYFSPVYSGGLNQESVWRSDTSANDSRAHSIGAIFGQMGNPNAGVIQSLVKTAGSNSTPWTTAQWVSAASIG